MVGTVHVSSQDPDKHIFDAPESCQPPKAWASTAHVSGVETYERMYKLSIDQPDQFWGKIAETDYHWHRKLSAPFCRYGLRWIVCTAHPAGRNYFLPQLEL